MASNTLTATAYDPTFGACTVTKVTARPFTYAVVSVSDDGAVSSSFHLTRAAADKAAARPGAVRRHTVETRIKRKPAPVAPTVPAPATTTLTELVAGDDITDMIRNNLNRGVMVAWINADLFNRADCDVRKSIVLYDDDRVFVMALGTSVTPEIFRDRAPLVADSMARAGVRYWSVGIA
jgi:hypothetical protein